MCIIVYVCVVDGVFVSVFVYDACRFSCVCVLVANVWYCVCVTAVCVGMIVGLVGLVDCYHVCVCVSGNA